MVKRGYHHGNLRQALIEAALGLIETRGPTGFTLAEAAKQAGVTPAAVYRHFDGREDLIAEAARQGYEIFADRMEEAARAAGADRASGNALARFEATARAYLEFAHAYPGHYVAMFESGISTNRTPELAAVVARGFGVVERAAMELAEHIPAERRPPPQMFSAHIWALSHGVVELFARGAPGTRSPFPPEELLETGIGIYLRGLGLLPPDR
ncbi:TetR family transcriptional regulator [Brevirhabdus pacifica]|uniref:TetR family transcriptional regulator n=2 Tax=Brevirhabdus pacifica TaxID=1267768 RepID=A0A1U7DF84_9RHOB|nr:TetR/AcrR family transcriptional regulator [Brevirhabdus pacifica]APX88559.1 TetR family transcriptional regulator [Brevirhabdus pacifica]OWU79850.1 TetR family transcriptional regulator [Loktanella sp. 22II-4b]PJJ86953.1 TetR family transcriptional regulator [Brevirhabdus pacifica]